MDCVIMRTDKRSGEQRYLARRRPEWPDDHVSHGSQLTGDIKKAYTCSSYPDAMTAAGVFATQTGTEDFDYEVIEVV
jgi:hypothetical protein